METVVQVLAVANSQCIWMQHALYNQAVVDYTVKVLWIIQPGYCGLYSQCAVVYKAKVLWLYIQGAVLDTAKELWLYGQYNHGNVYSCLEIKA